MAFSNVIGMQLPEGFSVSSYDRVNNLAQELMNPNDDLMPWKKDLWTVYASSWNALAYRLRAAAEYNETFVREIAEVASATREMHYAQEVALFGCLTSALSAIDSFYTAAYCFGSAFAPLYFPFHHEKQLYQTPTTVVKLYAICFPNDSFHKLLKEVQSSSEYRKLGDYRNVISHRGLLPRKHWLGNDTPRPPAIPTNPKALGSKYEYDAPLGARTCGEHLQWVNQAGSRLVDGLCEFTIHYGQK